ncbi:MAG: ADP-ribosylglycohydrolase family protein, partial [Planctomycetota bacterium]
MAQDIDDRVRGMLLGGMIGDAAGGPVEFVASDRWDHADVPFVAWAAGERLPQDLAEYGDGLELVTYDLFRPSPEGYAHWFADAPAGTLTDDTRHKAVLIDALRTSAELGREVTAADLALSYVEFVNTATATGFGELADEGLGEYVLAARWVLGERDANTALPPERMWGGLGTCAGQMALPPIAAVHPGDPEAAYVAAYEIAFIDNGAARDLNAAIVAGLAEALVIDEGTPWPTAWS